LASDDALLSAKAMSPNGAVQQATSHSGARQQLSTGGSTGPKFGAVESDGAPTNGQSEAPAVQVYSLLAPATDPDSTSKGQVSTLRLATTVDTSGTGGQSVPTTGRTIFSAAQRNEELLTARSATPAGASSPPGPQVRKSTTSPVIASQSITLQPHQPVRASPVPPAPTRSTVAPSGGGAASIMMGNPLSVCWPAMPSASAPAGPHAGYLMQAGAVDDLGNMVRMVSGSGRLAPSVGLSLERPLSPKRPLTPTPATARSVTPPPAHSAQAFSLEARSVTPTSKATHSLGVDGRLISACRPPPVSPAQVTARSAGLVRMPSNSQLPSYTSLRGRERSQSPARAVTPTPIQARSVTPTSAAQQRGTDAHAQLLRQARSSQGPLRSAVPAAVCAPTNRGSTPVRSVTHRGVLGGSHFTAPALSQPASLAQPGQPQELRQLARAPQQGLSAGLDTSAC
jgi:hypothetical protein